MQFGPTQLPSLMSPSRSNHHALTMEIDFTTLQILKVHISLVLNSFLFNLRKEKENNILTGSKNLKTRDYSTGSCFSDCRATCHCEATGSEQKIH